MKLLFVDEKPHLGGKYFYYNNLTTGLTDFGYELFYIKKKQTTSTIIKKIIFRFLSKFKLFDYSIKCLDIDCKAFCREVSLLNKKIKPDVIHIQHPLDAYFISFSKWKNIPIIQTVHSFWLNEIKNNYFSDAHLEKINTIQNFSYSYITNFIVLNNLQYNYLIKIGVNKDKIKIIANSVDKVKINKNAALAPFSFDSQYLSIVCRLSPEKGVDVALHALALINKNKRPRLVIAGEGSEKDFLKKLAKDLNISESVTFLGALDHNNALGVMKSSILNLCPSVNYNGIQDTAPLSVLESIALGVPVAASRIGGLPEYIKEGKNGYLFNEGDAKTLSEIISNHIDIINSGAISEMMLHMEELSHEYSNKFWINKKISIYEEMKNIHRSYLESN